MWKTVWKRGGWSLGAIALLAVLVNGVARKLPERRHAAVSPEVRRPSELDVDLVYDQQESVGWVFGRMVGFQGADKPLLPRPAPPSPFVASPANSYAR